MRVKRLKIKNFLKYTDKEFNLDYPISIFVGQNGTGKSTILEAISFALFGETSKKLTKKQLLTIGKKDGYVELFTDKFVIHRSIVKGKTYIDVYENDEHIENISQVNEIIESIVGIDKSHFMNLFYFQQGKLLDIVETTASDRKKLFDKLFFNDLSFENIYQWFRTLDSKYSVLLGSDTVESLTQQKNKLLDTIKVLKPKLINIKKQVDGLAENIQNKKQQLSELRKQYEVYDNIQKLNLDKNHYAHLLDELKSIPSDEEIEKMNQQLQKLEGFIDKADEYKQKKSDYQKLEQLLKNWNLFEEYSHPTYIKELSKNDYNETIISRLKDSRKNLFDSAKEDFENFSKTVLNHELLVLNAGYNELSMKNVEYIKKFKLIYTNYNVFNDLMEKYNINNRIDLENVLFTLSKQQNTDFKEYIDKYNDIKYQLYEINKNKKLQLEYTQRINEINQKLLSENLVIDIDQVSDKISLLETTIQELMDKRNVLVEEGYKLKYEYQNAKSEVDLVSNRIIEIQDIELRYKFINLMKNLFHRDKLPAYFRQAVYEPMKARIQSYIYKFGFNFKIDFDSKFNFTTDLFPTIHSLSGGQKVILSLAVKFAVSDLLGLKVPFLLIDEPTIHLDDVRVEEVINVVNELSKHVQIILVTHNDMFLNLGLGSVVKIAD